MLIDNAIHSHPRIFMSRFVDARGNPIRLSVWTWPLAVNALATTGLVSALVSDGWGDVWAWLALGLPVALMTWLALRRR
jgi:hypothetical protein